jgi:transcriptional regulator
VAIPVRSSGSVIHVSAAHLPSDLFLYKILYIRFFSESSANRRLHPLPLAGASIVTEIASNNLLRGTVDLLVLRTLLQGPMHGFAIARWIREGGGDLVSFEDAALYQSLHRLERKGDVESSWGTSDKNRRARFYELTVKGRERLRTESMAFRSYAEAINRLLETES